METLPPFFAKLQTQAAGRSAALNTRALTTIDAYTGRTVTIAGKEYLNFAGNDYLGLSVHPVLLQRAQAYLAQAGGNCSSRLILGNNSLYDKLETRLAIWKGMESVLVLSSGYALNVAALNAMAQLMPNIVFLLDKLVHASLIDGVRLSHKHWERFPHNQLTQLEELLAKHNKAGRQCVIVTEAVFSMDGDRAPLAELLRLTRKYKALCYIDEAHAVGVFGTAGEGFSREFNFAAYPEVISVFTFGKAFGAAGAAIATAAPLRDAFINTMRSLIFSTALPPVVLGTILESLKLLSAPANTQWGAELLAKAAQLRTRLAQQGIDTAASESQLIPVITGSNERALALAEALRNAGIWAPAIRPPTVPPATARVRLSLNALLRNEDIERAVQCIGQFFANAANHT